MIHIPTGTNTDLQAERDVQFWKSFAEDAMRETNKIKGQLAELRTQYDKLQKQHDSDVAEKAESCIVPQDTLETLADIASWCNVDLYLTIAPRTSKGGD